VKKRNSDIWLKLPVWVLGMGPLAWGVWAFFADELGANPVETLLLVPGRWALVFLLLGLAVSPVRRFTGWNRIIRVRRLLGLFAFFYASLHFLIYLAVDQGFAWSFILEDIAERPFITVGFAALVLLVPLAVTSTRGWIRRLGRRWQLLHRLVYPATALGALHFYWKVKADTFWPLVAAGILAALLLARVPGWTARAAGRRTNSGEKETRRTARIPPRGTLAEGR
jgi:sulfoxide reductase heme-binding subunit YedZ